MLFRSNLVSDRFPTRDRKDQILIPDELVKENLPSGDAHIQEERRLFYVGMTRAQKYLFMTLAKASLRLVMFPLLGVFLLSTSGRKLFKEIV